MSDAGEGALEMATTSKDGSRRETCLIPCGETVESCEK